MDAITSSSSIITVQRLRGLRHGETMTVYRGDFDLDLSQEGTPKYNELLHRVYKTMHALEREGRIALRVENEALETPRGKNRGV